MRQATPSPMQNSITLQAVTAEDKPFLFELFCIDRERQMLPLDLPVEQKNQLLQMQCDARDRQYHQQYPEADFDLILNNAEPVGSLFAQRGPDQFALIDIVLLPEHRNSGIATELVGDLIEAASKESKPLHAHVLRDNPAWRLWQRLGFRVVGDDGVYRRIEFSACDFAN